MKAAFSDDRQIAALEVNVAHTMSYSQWMRLIDAFNASKERTYSGPVYDFISGIESVLNQVGRQVVLDPDAD